MKESKADAELEKALHRAGYRLHSYEDGFTVEYVRTGKQTKLGASEASEALVEAWSLVSSGNG